MIDMNKVIKELPDMLSGNELQKTMSIIPKYDKQIQKDGSMTERLLKLSDLYSIYIPSQMSTEIYSKLYLGIIRSMQKKRNKLAVQQFNSTYRTMQNIKNKTGNQQYDGRNDYNCFFHISFPLSVYLLLLYSFVTPLL